MSNESDPAPLMPLDPDLALKIVAVMRRLGPVSDQQRRTLDAATRTVEPHFTEQELLDAEASVLTDDPEELLMELARLSIEAELGVTPIVEVCVEQDPDDAETFEMHVEHRRDVCTVVFERADVLRSARGLAWTVVAEGVGVAPPDYLSPSVPPYQARLLVGCSCRPF